MATRNYITRREYDAWISECTALAIACGYPIQDDMINDNTGLVFGEDQYEAFANGLWSGEPYEAFAIFQALNEPAVPICTGERPSSTRSCWERWTSSMRPRSSMMSASM